MSEEIKAKIVIEADTSGADEAAAALEKLQGATGASSDGAGALGDQLAAMEKQAGATAGEVSGLAEETKGFEEAASSGEEAVSSFSDTLGEHQQAIEDVQTAYEGLQDPVDNASKSFTSMQESLAKSSPAVSQFADNMTALQTALSPGTLEENMSVFQDLVTTPQPFMMLQGYLQETGQSMDGFAQSIGKNYSDVLGQMQQSNGVFADTQTAMGEFNQTDPWTAMATGAKNASEDVTTLGASTKQASDNFAAFNTNAQQVQKSADDITTSASAANQSMGDMMIGINKFGGVGSEQYGPKTFVESLAKESGGIGETLSGAMSDLGGFMMGVSSWIMPLMAFQMVGQMVMQVGGAIYDAAAIAEGPAAHSMGTFTGTVDALNQSMQQSGQSFSESFGQNMLPTLNALNYQMNQGGGAGGLGGALGSTASYLSNLGLIAGGLVSMTVPGGQGIGMQMIQGGGEGMINQIAQSYGLSQPFQGPGPADQAQIDYQKQFVQLPRTVSASATQLQYQGDMFMQEGSDPNYLAQAQYASSAQQYLQRQQASYNASHPAPSPRQLALDYQDKRYTAADQQAYQDYLNSGGTPITPDNAYTASGPSASGSVLFGPGRGIDFGALGNTFSGLSGLLSGGGGGLMDFAKNLTGIGSMFSGGGGIGDIGQGFRSFFGIGGGGQGMGAGGFFDGGCFVAGTPILMANGTQKPIEQLRAGEQVLGYDGNKQRPATILACITFPHKQTYELTFSDGNTLTLTDSHPLYSPDTGWRSLSPAMTREESPDLPISQLQIGDVISTINGTCTLVTIEKRQVEQVYNITVDGTHTYYANGVLTHNIKAGGSGGGAQSIGGQIADQIGSIQLPHIDLGGIASSIGGAFSGIQLPHLDLGGIASSLGGAFSGIQLPHIDLGNIGSSLAGAFSGIQLPHLDLGGIGSALSGAFSGITLPHIPDLGGMINGALGGMFSGITLPSIPDIGGMINGALGGMFSGITLPSIPDIGGMINGALGGVFSGITLPSIPNIGGMINGALGGMFSGITLPSIPDIGGIINGALGGMFGNIQMPSVPDVGAMINGALGGMFSSIQMPPIPNIGAMINGALGSMFSGIMIPAFASGIEGFSGGLAMVGEAGPELVSLPGGSSVYPLTTGSGVGSNNPISIGNGGGGAQTANISVYLDSQMLISLMGVSLMQSINVGLGKRSY
jgi:hypothetical protein